MKIILFSKRIFHVFFFVFITSWFIHPFETHTMNGNDQNYKREMNCHQSEKETEEREARDRRKEKGESEWQREKPFQNWIIIFFSLDFKFQFIGFIILIRHNNNKTKCSFKTFICFCSSIICSVSRAYSLHFYIKPKFDSFSLTTWCTWVCTIIFLIDYTILNPLCISFIILGYFSN